MVRQFLGSFLILSHLSDTSNLVRAMAWKLGNLGKFQGVQRERADSFVHFNASETVHRRFGAFLNHKQTRLGRGRLL